ncbi:hypothetical protein ACE1CD_28040 [Aerosakkonema sp. BLCC-F183]|uniref:hypothetical protein n=1 Tax=Aerosakkonema sp. BLCC-F183 TaxID=3342834 RepID=UPI0035B75F57
MSAIAENKHQILERSSFAQELKAPERILPKQMLNELVPDSQFEPAQIHPAPQLLQNFQPMVSGQFLKLFTKGINSARDMV